MYTQVLSAKVQLSDISDKILQNRNVTDMRSDLVLFLFVHQRAQTLYKYILHFKFNMLLYIYI